MNRSKILIATAIALMTVVAYAQVRTELLARMSGFGKSKAVYKAKGTEAEFQVEGENLARNTTYAVTSAGSAWTVTTNSLGVFRLTQRYGATGRPAIALGTAIQLRTTLGVVVQNGTFAPK